MSTIKGTLLALASAGLPDVPKISAADEAFLLSLPENFSDADAQRIKEIEAVTNHDVKAVEYFLKEKNVDTKKLYVAFVSMELHKDRIHDLKMSQVKPDEVHIDQNKIFIKYAVSAGKTKLDQKYIEKKLNLTATIRNWNTVTNLLNMYEEKE